MFYLACVTFLLVLLVSSAEAMRRCSFHYCQVQTSCANYNRANSACSMDSEYLRRYKFFEKILKMHNDFRNEIAKGSFHGFAVAARMATMEWDDNLERIAEFSLSECRLQGRNCFFTQEYPKPGVNMAYNQFMCAQNTNLVIDAQLFMWIDEGYHANMNSLLTGESVDGHEIGHFLQMVQDSADRVGCAFLQMEKDNWFYRYISCAYNVRYEKNKIAYTPGKTPGEKCMTGTNPLYVNLCSTKEVYENGDENLRRFVRSTKKTKQEKTTTKQNTIESDSGTETDSTNSKDSKSKSNSHMGNVLKWLKKVDPNMGIKLDVAQTNIKKKQKDSMVLNIVNRKGR